MILVDVIVPAIDKKYDFFLEENICISSIIFEMCEMISQKEHCNIVGDKNKFLLCFVKEHRALSSAQSLLENGVRTGDSLMLV